MTSAYPRTSWRAVLFAAAAFLTLPAAAHTLFHPAENQVRVAMIGVVLAGAFTEVHLQTQAALTGVCWNSSGPDSPYLLSDGHRYRFLNGDNISACPARQGYADKDVMVLRFEPLDAKAREFSLVEGEGGERQLTDPKSSATRYWNFLHVKLK
jgi:hypothetical protein